MKRPERVTQSLIVLLQALASGGQQWRYGYDLSRETELKSGTIYPLLIRLEQCGLLETRWSEPGANGAPPRHLYRLSADGRVYALELRGGGEVPLAAT